MSFAKTGVCVGLSSVIGVGATVGFRHESDRYYSCPQAILSDAEPCVPSQRWPIEDPHAERMGSTSSAAGLTVALISGMPEWPAAFALQRALPKGDETQLPIIWRVRG
jgi:hypothetical protein